MNITHVIKLTETYFRGKSKTEINAKLSDFCKEHSLQERDIKTIISKIHLRKKKKYAPKTKTKVRRRTKNNIEILNRLVVIPIKENKEVIPENTIIIPVENDLERRILRAITNMTRTEAYKWWGKFRSEITPREFRTFVQKHIKLSARYYECEALRLPKVVKIPKHIGKKKKQFSKGLRTSRSRKCNLKIFNITQLICIGKMKKNKRIRINKNISNE